MRLNALHLTKYGLFTNKSLNFGKRRTGKPDFHVVYGLNEAGKSTALEAWNDLLFGIKWGTPYGYLHSSAMEVGAVLDDNEGHPVGLKRIRKQKNSLLDMQNANLEESFLQELLGGFSRSDYELLFSVDEETLERGGNEILDSKGDLGKMLFSASTGITEVTRILDDLSARNEEFYRPRSRKSELLQIKNRMNELKQKWRENDIDARVYQRQVEQLGEAQRHLDQVRKGKGELESRLSLIERKLNALPLVRQYQQIQSQIDEQDPLPQPPDDWRTKIEQLSTKLTENKTNAAQEANSIERLKAELAANQVDPVALRIKDRVDQVERLRPSYEGAVKDLPRRTEQAQQLKTEVGYLAQRLGLDLTRDGEILPDAATIGRIRNLMEEHSGIMAIHDASRDELAATEAKLEELDIEMEGREFHPEEAKKIQSLLKEVHDEDPRAELNLTNRQIADLEGKIETRMVELLPWKGNSGDLQIMKAPYRAQLREIEDAVREARQVRKNTRQRISELETSRKAIEKSMAELPAGDAVSIEDVANSRNLRESRWAEHKQALDMDTARLFEKAMRQNDEIVIRAGEQNSQSLLSKERQGQHADMVLKIDAEKESLDRCDSELQKLRDNYRSFWQATLNVEDDPPSIDGFISWLECRTRVLEDIRNLESLKSRKNSLLSRVENYRHKLRNALQQMGETGDDTMSLRALLDFAEQTVTDYQQLKSLRDQHWRIKLDHTRRRKTYEDAREKKDSWHQKWAMACADSTLCPERQPSVVEMREIIQIIDEIVPKFTEMRSVEQRIEKMTEDRQRFEDRVGKFAQELEIQADTANLKRTWQEICNQTRQADQNAINRTRIREQLDRHKDNKAFLEEELSRLQMDLESIGHPYGQKELQDIKSALERADHYEQLKKSRSNALDTIQTIMQSASIEAALDEVQGLNQDALEIEKSCLEDSIRECQQDIEEKVRAKRDVERELEKITGDDSIASLKEEYANLEMQLNQKTRDHLKVKFGLIALEHAIRRFRDIHKSAMMSLASDKFARVSVGNYQSLGTAQEKNKEVLVANASDGSTKFVRDLSKGTRFQLYLALRVAGYYEILKNNPPIPFVADDILDSFDNQRTGETLKILEDMSKKGQVIYFTHHQHLCDIASEVCPDVNIQSL